MLAGETFGELQRRLILIDVAGFEPRRHDAPDACRTKRQLPLARENVALFVCDAVNPNAMRKDSALGLFDWRLAEVHAAALSERNGFLRSEATISPMIDTAISAGLTAPMSSPIGAWMRDSAVSSNP